MIGVGQTSGHLVVGVLWIMGLVVIGVETRFPAYRRLTFVLGLASVASAAAMAGLMWPGEDIALAGGGVKLDGFALFVQAFVMLGAVCAFLLGRHEREGWRPGSNGLLLLSAAGVALLAMSVDLIGVLAGFLAALIPLLGMAALAPEDSGREAALKGMVLALLGTALSGLGTAIVLLRTGTSNLEGIRNFLMTDVWIGTDPLLVVALALILCGFGLFMAIVPFHMLFTDVVEGLPTPAAMLLSGCLVASGLAACCRVLLVGFGPAASSGTGYLSWVDVLHTAGLVALLVGNAMALVQRRLKRMLAFLATGQAGMVLVTLSAVGHLAAEGGLGLGAALGGVLAFLGVYAVNWVGLFLAVSAIDNRSRGIGVGDLDGLAKRNPWLAAAIGLALLCMAGMPLTAGFFTRLYLLEAMVDAGWVGTAVVVALSLGLVLAMTLGLVTAMYLRQARENVTLRTSPALIVTAWLSALIILALGIFPGGVLELAVRSASTLLGS